MQSLKNCAFKKFHVCHAVQNGARLFMKGLLKMMHTSKLDECINILKEAKSIEMKTIFYAFNQLVSMNARNRNNALESNVPIAVNYCQVFPVRWPGAFHSPPKGALGRSDIPQSHLVNFNLPTTGRNENGLDWKLSQLDIITLCLSTAWI